MGPPLLLDEMLRGAIAKQLRDQGHDVTAVVEDHGFLKLSDDELLAAAVAQRRALVTVNIKDFALLDDIYRASARSHYGLVYISSKTFPQNRSFTGAIVRALDALLASDAFLENTAVFLERTNADQPARPATDL